MISPTCIQGIIRSFDKSSRLAEVTLQVQGSPVVTDVRVLSIGSSSATYINYKQGDVVCVLFSGFPNPDEALIAEPLYNYGNAFIVGTIVQSSYNKNDSIIKKMVDLVGPGSYIFKMISDLDSRAKKAGPPATVDYIKNVPSQLISKNKNDKKISDLMKLIE